MADQLHDVEAAALRRLAHTVERAEAAALAAMIRHPGSATIEKAHFSLARIRKALATAARGGRREKKADRVSDEARRVRDGVAVLNALRAEQLAPPSLPAPGSVTARLNAMRDTGDEKGYLALLDKLTEEELAANPPSPPAEARKARHRR